MNAAAIATGLVATLLLAGCTQPATPAEENRPTSPGGDDTPTETPESTNETAQRFTHSGASTITEIVACPDPELLCVDAWFWIMPDSLHLKAGDEVSIHATWETPLVPLRVLLLDGSDPASNRIATTEGATPVSFNTTATADCLCTIAQMHRAQRAGRAGRAGRAPPQRLVCAHEAWKKRREQRRRSIEPICTLAWGPTGARWRDA